MIKPIKFRMKFRKAGNNKCSVGFPKEIAEQITSEHLFMYVDNGKIVLEPGNNEV